MRELLQHLLKICNQTLEDYVLKEDDNFFETDISSLALSEMHQCISDEYPDVVDITDLLEYQSVIDLAKFIEEKSKKWLMFRVVLRFIKKPLISGFFNARNIRSVYSMLMLVTGRFSSVH